MTRRSAERVLVFAGVPATNMTLYHRLRFSVGDPVALIVLEADKGVGETILILRDIEMGRARQQARADRIACPADFSPAGGLSGDRETATAQALAEYLVRDGIERVTCDRSFPFLYAHELHARGIGVDCDTALGVTERRRKDEQELAWLRRAQSVTEQVVERACRMVAGADVASDGTLRRDGQVLTSERVREEIDLWLLKQGFANPPCIVAGGPDGADCHQLGSGSLRTGQPVIIDVFPRDRHSLYYGDCTRTVVHGPISPALVRMHEAVVAAKLAASAVCRAGATGEEVHEAAAKVMTEFGFAMGLPSEEAPEDFCAMVHGTGHGIGLDVHEPPLLDRGGPELVAGDVVTVEPGLYSRALGGIRVEDMIVVRDGECEVLNRIPEGLDWT
jgi:Xaa-Pro aminopeptidase